MEEFYERLRKSFDPKPSTAHKRPKADRTRKACLTPFQQWSRSVKNGTIKPNSLRERVNNFTAINNSNNGSTRNESQTLSRNPMSQLQNIPSAAARRSSRRTNKILESIHLVPMPGKENNGTCEMVPMVAIPLVPIAVPQYPPHPTGIYQPHNPHFPPASMSSPVTYRNPHPQITYINDPNAYQANFQPLPVPDVLNTSLANAFNLPEITNSGDSNHQTRIQTTYENRSYSQLPDNQTFNVTDVHVASSEESSRSFDDIVVECNGRIYAESSDVNRPFSHLLLEDDTGESIEIEELTPSLDKNAVSVSTSDSLIDSDLAYTLSESSMVSDYDDNSFFDVLKNVGTPDKEEKDLAKRFLEVFENVEKLIADSKQNRTNEEADQAQREMEAEIVFDGSEPWMTPSDLKNEALDVNCKLDLDKTTTDEVCEDNMGEL